MQMQPALSFPTFVLQPRVVAASTHKRELGLASTCLGMPQAGLTDASFHQQYHCQYGPILTRQRQHSLPTAWFEGGPPPDFSLWPN
ncbi:hypothetical protein B0T25DRAFT_124317 [Lasiosphaeria hispida]|uniref:Uncharacterized protein n=1 Tax=Lasiosphaeria hispida TaxID=260671 RepID=A0AAJ0MII0_9PEZI|nr:hypothetical protein B0T25DRAFT_124317 [Lasiosphaeria hispida]